jgi:gliding motility-associated-like protein
MKLKLLFFIGILSVLFNTMNGQNTAPVFQVPPLNRTDCPGYTAANIQYQVTDANTPASLLVVTASAVGAQAVNFNYTQDPTGILRAVDVIPVGPIIPGVVTVTLTLSDVGLPLPNLSTTAVFTVNFEDITDPIISTILPLPNIVENISATAGCKFTVPDYTSLISATDYCGGVIITQSPAAGTELTVAHNDPVTITITATDDYGNDVSTSFDVTVTDVTDPTITSAPLVDIDESIDGSCNFTIPDYTSLLTATDNCGAVTVTQTPPIATILSAHGTTQLITLTADDGNGNDVSATFTITLKDVTDPTITSVADFDEFHDALDCDFSIPDYTSLVTASDACGVVSVSQSPATGTLSGHNATQLITLTADDSNGNTATTTFTITVKDVTDPTISAVSDFDVDINVTDCDFTIPDYTGLVTTFDNCGIVTVTQSPIGTILSNHNTPQLITLTANDGNGNTSDSTFTITLKDVTDPIITSAPLVDIDESIDGSCNFTIPDYTSLLTATDNCGAVTVTQTPPIATILSAHGTTQLITLTADDGNGNDVSATFTITLKDVTDPTITSVADFDEFHDALDCDFSIPDYTSLVTASDACGVVSVSQSPATGTLSGHNATQLITLTADDSNGNTATTTFTITVKDVTDPTISAVSDFDVDINVTDCDFTIPDYTGLVTTFDNCGIVTVTQSPIGTILSNHNTPQLITLTANDGNGNTSDSTFTITLKDVTLPTITTNGDFNEDNDPGQCGALVTVSATASDNCTSPIAPNGVRDDLAALNAPYPVGTTTITWSVSDANGNSASSTQTVTVNDVEDPVFASLFPDLTVNNDPGLCSYDTSQLPVPSVSDNCTPFSGVVTVDPATIPVSAGPDHIPSIVTWTATDNAGNTVTATQNVTVQDLELPVMRTKNITLYYDANGQIIITPQDIDDGSTDNSGTDCFTKYVVPNILYCGDKGDNSVILTGTDLWGNQHYKEATVTAVDNANPTISAPGAITLNTNTGCTWVGTLVSPTTADNCSVVSVTNDAPAALPLGDTTVTWTVTDASGNTATTTQVVTVIDVEKPIAIAKLGVVVTLDPAGEAIITAIEIDNGSTDNCVIDSITVSPDNFDCDNVGANVVTLTVTDDSGNVSTANAIVTVIDDILPVIASVSAISANTSPGICGANITVTAPTASDNCSVGTPVGTRSDSKALNAVYPVGTTVITWNVNDANGNVAASVTQTVDVTDTEKPTISVTNITVDTNAGCIWTGTLGLPVTADNCSVVSVTSDKAADFAYPVGVTTVIWTVKDLAGNTETATQTVTVRDTEKPIAKASDITIKLSSLVGAGAATITVADIDNGSSDNCGIRIIDGLVISKSSFDCTNVGANTVILTVTDISGNVSTANAIVTVIDDIIPVIASVSAITANTSPGICGSNITVTAPTATDNCSVGTPVGTRSDSKALNAAYPVGTTVITWNVNDANGNVATSVTQTVDVTDTEKPTISVTNITVDTNAGCIWTGTLGLPTTTDNCSVVSVTSDKAADFAYPVGVTTVIWTVKDLAGNTETATQTVTVRDTEKPIAKASDITIKLSSLVGAGAATITVADIDNGSSDNCGIRIIDGLVISKSSFDCTNVGANTVVLTVTDTSGNVSTANAIVTVIDDTLPVIAPVLPIVVTASAGICGANLAVTPSATATDNCTVSTPVGTRSDAKALTAVYPLGRTIITWNVKDANGNAALLVIQTVDVTDDEKPVITTNGNKNVNVDGNSCAAIVNVAATATDNCTVGSPTGVRSDAKPLAAVFPVGTTTITWNVTDVNGNAAVAVEQTVVVTDNIIPVITANGNKNLVSDLGQCGAIVAVSATATDNCSVTNPVVGTRSDAAAINALYPVGTTTITWNVNDVNGNAAAPVVQTVTVRDLQIPVINGTVVSIDADTDANACGATVTVTPPAASDNCSVGAPVGTRSDNLALTALYPIGTTTITWKVTDINGNAAIPTTTTVKVKDMVLPTVNTRNIPVQLNVGGFATIVPAQVNNGSIDNCGIASYSLDKISFNCSNIGDNTVTLTVIDIHGNVASAPALVTVTEPIIPIALTRNITVQLNAVGSVSILPSDINNGSTDNCAIDRYELSKDTFDCSNVGQNIITLTAIDTSGNRSVPVNATVTVQDKIAPVVSVIQPYLTVQLNALGTVSITPADVNNGSTDACGILTYSLSKSTFTCANVGSNVVTLTATDVHGNVNQAFATVLVVDSVKPVVVAKDIELVLDGISVSITPEDVFVSATDACGVNVHSYTLSRDTFTIVDVLNSPVTVTLSVTDVNGNVGTDDFLITFPTLPTVANEVITPNGDGTNDTWVIDNITNHPDSVVKVYNTWGSLIFSAKNYQNNWDGKLNGNDVTLPDGGSYYYQIDLDGNGTVEEQGWLYITRQ